MMWPDVIRITTIGFRVTGIDHIHLIYLAIAVPVVVRIINKRVGLNARFPNKFSNVDFSAIFIVTTIVSHIILGSKGPYHIKV